MGPAQEPKFSDAAGILLYLSKRSEAFRDTREPGPWARRLNFLSVGSTFLVVLAGLFFLMVGLRHNPVVRWVIPTLGCLSYALWFARFVVWLPRLWRTRKVWSRPTLVRIIERDEAHALPLTTCNESLLVYVKESLKRHIATVTGRSNLLLDNKKLIALLPLSGWVWKDWADIQAHLLALHFETGFLDGIREYAHIWVLGIVAWFLLLRFSVWWSTSNYTYQMELVETAISNEESNGGSPRMIFSNGWQQQQS